MNHNVIILQKIFFELFGINILSLESNERLREDLGLDSINLVNLQVEIEDRFSIYFDPLSMDISKIFATIGSIREFIEGIDKND